MKNLEFWQGKYKEAKKKQDKHRAALQVFEYVAKLQLKFKLKLLRGCRLHRRHSYKGVFGSSTENRRQVWLKLRLKDLTMAAKHRKLIKQIESTKLTYFEKMIRKLGGTV